MTTQSPKPIGWMHESRIGDCFRADVEMIPTVLRPHWQPVYSESTVRELEAKIPQWQPIDQAPRNSTIVDVWDAERGERIANVRRVDLGGGNVFYEPVEHGPTCIRGATHFMLAPRRPIPRNYEGPRMNRDIAALFVEDGGVYFGLPGVDPWPEKRDARLYGGTIPVVAHPPCQRWGRFWSGNPTQQPRLKLGDDNGCFASALSSVRTWGGVLEHPEASHAWAAFGLNRPPKTGGWIPADQHGGWTCCVEQGNYGHLSRKATWLYMVGATPPSLIWGKSSANVRVAGAGFRTKEARDAARALGKEKMKQLPTKLRNATPREFRDLLIALARSVAQPATTKE